MLSTETLYASNLLAFAAIFELCARASGRLPDRRACLAAGKLCCSYTPTHDHSTGVVAFHKSTYRQLLCGAIRVYVRLKPHKDTVVERFKIQVYPGQHAGPAQQHQQDSRHLLLLLQLFSR